MGRQQNGERRILAFASDRVCCPTCGRPIRRVLPYNGTVLVHCEYRIPTPAAPDPSMSPKCGQHFHVHATLGRVAYVVAVSRQEFLHLAERPLPELEAYKQLGLVR